MIKKPVVIIGAPRSGTSLLQKILRGHPMFWSLPSESDIVWDRYCHPRLNCWESDRVVAEDATETVRNDIQERFDRLVQPSHVWKQAEKLASPWSYTGLPATRVLLKAAYLVYSRTVSLFRDTQRERRIVEKTVGNCFRLSFVMSVFPDAKVLYITRDARNNISSLIEGWKHPTRFFSYEVPEELSIKGYEGSKWNFVLPPDWKSCIDKPLEEVCAVQWRACHESVLSDIAAGEYDDRVCRFKLEELSSNPGSTLRKITEFVDVPYDEYFTDIARTLPVVNSPDGNTSQDKWKQQHGEAIRRVLPSVQDVMHKLEYEL